MRPVDAEFATQERPYWPWTVCALALGVAAVWQGQLAWRTWESANKLEQRGAAVRLQRDAARAEASAKPMVTSRRPTANAPSGQAARFDWDGALAPVHCARVPGVWLTTMDLSAADGTARLEIEGGRIEDLLLYLSALNEGEVEPRWRLQQLQAPKGAATAKGTIGSVPQAFVR